MLNIIHLLDTLRFGGAESVALNYARVMAEWGTESMLCGRLQSTDFERFASQYAAVGPFSWRAVRRADVIFIHSNRQLLRLFLCFLIFSRRNKRTFYIQHLRYSGRKLRFLTFFIHRLCTGFIRITPITETIVNQHVKIPVTFIPNFYLPRYAPDERAGVRKATRKELYVSEKQELILFSGALKPSKGLDDFLTLAAGFSEDDRFRFVVVGDGPQAAKIRAYPYKNLLWMGWQADVERFLLAADRYFFLSSNEMMPMALIEARTLGGPVWAVPSPLNESLINDRNHTTEAASEKLKNLTLRKILHIQVLPKLTGVQRVSLEILRALPNDEYEKTILFGGPTNPQTGDCQEKFHAAGCKVLFFNELKREIGWHDWRAFWKIYRLCRRERFDIVHTHSTKPGIVGRIAARLAGVPQVIHTVHGVAFHQYESFIHKIIYYISEMIASLFSHKIGLVSNYYKKYYRPFHRRINTIYNGISEAAISSSTTAQPDDGPVRLLFVGRLEAAKDPFTLLRAMAILQARRPGEFRLTIVGDGSLMTDCQVFVEKNDLKNAVHFAGWQQDPTPYYKHSQIFCLSSIHEAFGLCLLEAGNQGVPAVATRVGGVPEVVEAGVTGLLVPPCAPEAMAEAVIELANNPERWRKMGRAARERVQKMFPVERMIKTYKSLYNNEL